jgi:hypothetical protein
MISPFMPVTFAVRVTQDTVSHTETPASVKQRLSRHAVSVFLVVVVSVACCCSMITFTFPKYTSSYSAIGTRPAGFLAAHPFIVTKGRGPLKRWWPKGMFLRPVS